jgi:hypothetical protein
MPHDLVRPPKARRGDRVAVLSPSFAAAGAFPAVHEQAMRRLAEVTGLAPVEFPATRKVGATPAERAADVNAVFADPGIRAILAVIGGDDQITVIPHLDAALARRDPKPFLGYSDKHQHASLAVGERHRQFLRRVVPGAPRAGSGGWTRCMPGRCARRWSPGR